MDDGQLRQTWASEDEMSNWLLYSHSGQTPSRWFSARHGVCCRHIPHGRRLLSRWRCYFLPPPHLSCLPHPRGNCVRFSMSKRCRDIPRIWAPFRHVPVELSLLLELGHDSFFWMAPNRTNSNKLFVPMKLMLQLYCSVFCLKVIGFRGVDSFPLFGLLILNLHHISEPWQDSNEHNKPWQISWRIQILLTVFWCAQLCLVWDQTDSSYAIKVSYLPKNCFSWTAHTERRIVLAHFFPKLPLQQKFSMIWRIITVTGCCLQPFWEQGLLSPSCKPMGFWGSLGEHLDSVILVFKLYLFKEDLKNCSSHCVSRHRSSLHHPTHHPWSTACPSFSPVSRQGPK